MGGPLNDYLMAHCNNALTHIMFSIGVCLHTAFMCIFASLLHIWVYVCIGFHFVFLSQVTFSIAKYDVVLGSRDFILDVEVCCQY